MCEYCGDSILLSGPLGSISETNRNHFRNQVCAGFFCLFFGVNDQQDDENRQRVLLIGFLVGAYTKKVAEK